MRARPILVRVLVLNDPPDRGGAEVLLLRVSNDGRRVRWGRAQARGHAPPPTFHHTMAGRRTFTASPRVHRAWFQRLNLQYDELLSNFAFHFNLCPYAMTRLR